MGELVGVGKRIEGTDETLIHWYYSNIDTLKHTKIEGINRIQILTFQTNQYCSQCLNHSFIQQFLCFLIEFCQVIHILISFPMDSIQQMLLLIQGTPCYRRSYLQVLHPIIQIIQRIVDTLLLLPFVNLPSFLSRFLFFILIVDRSR